MAALLCLGTGSRRASPEKRKLWRREHLLKTQLQARRTRVEPTESIVSTALVDPKGKAARFSSQSTQKEKEIEAPCGGDTQKGKAVVLCHVYCENNQGTRRLCFLM